MSSFAKIRIWKHEKPSQHVLITDFRGYTRLDVHCMMAAPRRVSQQYTAVPEFAAVARAQLIEYLRALELSEERQFAILYATGEALANAIEHGSASPGVSFTFHIERQGRHLRVQIESTGRWRAFEPSEERGRGIPIMEALADQVDITTDTAGTIVHLSFRL